MKLQDIRIYNQDLELVAIIPDFIAANWEIKFSEFGTGEIEFPATSYIVSLLTQNEYLFLVHGDIQSVITGYNIEKTCTVFTRTLEWLLTKFVITQVPAGENMSKTVENILSVLPDEFNLKFCGLDDEYDMSDFVLDKATDVYSAIKSCINKPEVGILFKADFKEKTFTFYLKTASENANTLLCDQYKTSYDSNYTHDIQGYLKGIYYYHQLTCMGRYDVVTNSPSLAISKENYGKYYIVLGNGTVFGLSVKNGDILACTTKDGVFRILDEAKPFLVENPPDVPGIFSWSEVLNATNETDAENERRQKIPMDILTFKTRLEYGTDYKIGDIMSTRFYCENFCISKRKLVSGVHLWVERNGVGASPTMTDL